MSNEVTAGKRVLFRVAPEDDQLTPGVVGEVLAPTGVLDWHVSILSARGTFVRPRSEVKLGTQDTDPAAWMLHDGFTSTPAVYRKGCYICEDPEFAQMGLPLCRKCPECVRQGRGDGHIAADESACSDCGYEDGPEDYPSAGS